MKALIISDKQEVIKLLQKRLEKEGFDIIIYRWLLKALDNIEEIRPDYIVLSAQEYPRHWKTLASFVQSGIGGNDVRFCLYNDEVLSAEDKQKAEQLGVEFYSDLREIKIEEETESVDEIENSIEEESDIPTVTDIFIDNKKDIKDINKNYSVVFTNPENNSFICGNSVQTSFDTFECAANNTGLSINQKIKYVTVSNDNNCISFCGEVISLSSDKVSLKVLSYYEK